MRHPRLTRRAFNGRAAACLAAAAATPVIAARAAPAAADQAIGPRILRATALGNEPSAALGYDGAVPGPALRLRRGDALWLRFVNDLGEPTSVHWHGLRRANALASPPRRAVTAANESADIRFACPDAGTFWYHAVDPAQRRRGLYGLVVVTETEPVAVDRELALIVGESPATADTPKPDAPPPLIANGALAATTAVRPNERLRLRLVNAASIVMSVRLDRLRAHVVALDGQPCEPFVVRDGRVFLGPGNRADLFVDIVLSAGAAQAIVAETDTGAVTIATLACEGEPVRPAPFAEPAPLPANPLPARMDFSGALKLDIDLAAAIPAMPPKPAFAVRRGRVVMLGLVNKTARLQTVRLDGHAFRLLDRLDDGWKPFWLDTVVVPPGRTHRVAFATEEVGAWLIEAADQGGQAGLTTWFAVT